MTHCDGGRQKYSQSKISIACRIVEIALNRTVVTTGQHNCVLLMTIDDLTFDNKIGITELRLKKNWTFQYHLRM